MTDQDTQLPDEAEQNDDPTPTLDVQSAGALRFLLTSLIIAGIFILTLIFLIFAYPILLAPAPTATPTVTPTRRATLTPSPAQPSVTITPSPAATRTPLPTFTPTPSLTPTRTQTPGATPTPTGPATLTPASPRNDNRLYKLATWTPEKADELIAQLDYYPYTLARQNVTPNNQAFYNAYEFAAFARQEAVLQFPEAGQAEGWQWGLAYNLAQTGNQAAAAAYAELITAGLNAGLAIPETLPGWFASQEPELILNLIPLEPLPGYVASFIIELRGAGSAYLWLLETSQAYRVQALASDFDFVNRPESSGILSDLNGDGIEDTGFYSAQTPENLEIKLPLVFNLAQPDAQKMEFLPADGRFTVGIDFRNYWVVAKKDNETSLVFDATVFPACPVTIRRYYRWDGNFFAYQDTEFQLDPNAVKLNECELLANHSAQTWGPEAAVQIMEPLEPFWPPEEDMDGSPYSADARDEWRYRLGLYSALAGDSSRALAWMNTIIQEPSNPISRWIVPASQFLAQYQSPEDIYRACLPSEFCLPHPAIQSLVDTLSPAEFPNAIERFRDWGMEPISSGFFDFDDDGQTERWFTIRHQPLERLEFWILAAEVDGGEALYVGNVDSTRPDLYFLEADFLANPDDAPVAFLEGQIAFAMRREPTTRRPYLERIELRREYPNRFFIAQEKLEERLLSGEDPGLVYRDLLNLQETPGLLCAPFWTCDRYYYLLGLAAELSGRRDAAVEAYLELWRNYSRSPFTTMARFKLEGSGIIPSATPTSTLSPTPGPSPTPTVTGTPPTATPTITGTPPTATPTADPNASPTPTPTVTDTPFFGPTDTPTPTGTETPTPTVTETPTETPSPTTET